MVYVDLTEPDSVVLYQQSGQKSALDSIEEMIGSILSYF